MNPANLSDDDLEFLKEAITVRLAASQSTPAMIGYIAALSEDELDGILEACESELEKREAAETRVRTAHMAEHGEAQAESGPSGRPESGADLRNLFRLSAARLVKLVSMEAPEQVILNEVDMLGKRAAMMRAEKAD